MGRQALAGVPEDVQRTMVVGLKALLGQYGTALEDMRKLFATRRVPGGD